MKILKSNVTGRVVLLFREKICSDDICMVSCEIEAGNSWPDKRLNSRWKRSKFKVIYENNEG